MATASVLHVIGNLQSSRDDPELSANPYCPVDPTATINHTVGHHQAIRLLRDRLTRMPNVLSSSAPDVDVLQFTPAGSQLCVRPLLRQSVLLAAQVYFDTTV